MKTIQANGNLTHNARQHPVKMYVGDTIVEMFEPDYLADIEKKAKAVAYDRRFVSYRLVCENCYTVLVDHSEVQDAKYMEYIKFAQARELHENCRSYIEMPTNGVFYMEGKGSIKLFGVKVNNQKVIAEGSTFAAACMALFARGRI